MKLAVQIRQLDDGRYLGVCPSLPGCICRGCTRREITEAMDDVIRSYLAAIGNFVPEKLPCEFVDA